MTMDTSIQTAQQWFERRQQDGGPFLDETLALRRIALAVGLSETLKWRQPTYTDKGRNIGLIGVYKDGCVLSLFKGALLADPAGLLQSAGPNVRSAKVLRFAELAAIEAAEEAIAALLQQAIEVERSGRKVEKPKGELELVAELQQRLDENPELKAAFEALTKGRQRGYNLHFAKPKQAKSRLGLVDRWTPRILAGKGLRDCVCGHSGRLPGCDGSHKGFPGSRPF